MGCGISRRRILLVDDDQIILDSLSYGLGKARYRVEQCNTAGEAIDCYTNSPPDLAIVDIGLPDMRGTDLAASLLQHRYRPILILSSYSDSEWIDQAIGSGVIGYLVKPITAEQIIPSIETALARYGDISQRIARKFGGNNADEKKLAAALDQFPFGIVIIDQDHHVIHNNEPAGRLLADENVIINVHGKLRSHIDSGAFTGMLESSLNQGDLSTPAYVRLRTPRDQGEIQAWGIPLLGAQEHNAKSAIIIINDPSLTTIAPSSLLRTLFCLSRKESQLAHALANGASIKQYCEHKFISQNTARSHLKSIYRKTSTNRQVDLIRLLSRLYIYPPST